jgi:hypothetical protein
LKWQFSATCLCPIASAPYLLGEIWLLSKSDKSHFAIVLRFLSLVVANGDLSWALIKRLNVFRNMVKILLIAGKDGYSRCENRRVIEGSHLDHNGTWPARSF